MAERKGTEAARLAALRALVGVADREDFGDQLGAAIFTGPRPRWRHDVVAAARRGLQRLDRRPWPSFDLPCQLVDILEPLVEVDEPTALALVGRSCGATPALARWATSRSSSRRAPPRPPTRWRRTSSPSAGLRR